MKTMITLPSPNYRTEHDLDRLRVGDELQVFEPGNPRWATKPMHCIVRELNPADDSVTVERLR